MKLKHVNDFIRNEAPECLHHFIITALFHSCTLEWHSTVEWPSPINHEQEGRHFFGDDVYDALLYIFNFSLELMEYKAKKNADYTLALH